MPVGTIITLNSAREVVMRQPVWPFPAKGEFPRRVGDRTQYFVSFPYYRFPLYQPVPESFLHLFPELP